MFGKILKWTIIITIILGIIFSFLTGMITIEYLKEYPISIIQLLASLFGIAFVLALIIWLIIKTKGIILIVFIIGGYFFHNHNQEKKALRIEQQRLENIEKKALIIEQQRLEKIEKKERLEKIERLKLKIKTNVFDNTSGKIKFQGNRYFNVTLFDPQDYKEVLFISKIYYKDIVKVEQSIHDDQAGVKIITKKDKAYHYGDKRNENRYDDYAVFFFFESNFKAESNKLKDDLTKLITYIKKHNITSNTIDYNKLHSKNRMQSENNSKCVNFNYNIMRKEFTGNSYGGSDYIFTIECLGGLRKGEYVSTDLWIGESGNKKYF
jgi:hypothetical protein